MIPKPLTSRAISSLVDAVAPSGPGPGVVVHVTGCLHTELVLHVVLAPGPGQVQAAAPVVVAVAILCIMFPSASDPGELVIGTS